MAKQASGGGISQALGMLSRRQVITIAIAVVASALAGILHFAEANAVLTFVVSGVALATLAALVGDATEQLGTRLGPGATGVLQSALGNLPELFVGIFALRAGLVDVVQSALIGSILGNSVLVLGLAFLVGGLRHGEQKFSSDPPRMMVTLTLLAVAALAIPTLAFLLHTPAQPHSEGLSIACAIILLLVFLASIPISLAGGPASLPGEPAEAIEAAERVWPVWLAVAILVVAALGAAFVSEWFIAALEPTIAVLHLSQAFTGLVIVALAGNAVEHVVGIQLMAANKPDYAISVIMNSSLQIALFLVPVLVLLSLVLGGAYLTLVVSPLLLVALGLAALLGAIIIYDGKSTWLEGLTLIGLYCILAVSFWWG
ncbi:MAG TPA: calcium/proton exchanger [Ktedonobacterales bacterium]|nr:calcium/proton exchanger [Ktedonobacterales bacterium]